jgi:hypothetical protein
VCTLHSASCFGPYGAGHDPSRAKRGGWELNAAVRRSQQSSPLRQISRPKVGSSAEGGYASREGFGPIPSGVTSHPIACQCAPAATYRDEYDRPQIAATAFHTCVPVNMMIFVFALIGTGFDRF